MPQTQQTADHIWNGTATEMAETSSLVRVLCPTASHLYIIKLYKHTDRLGCEAIQCDEVNSLPKHSVSNAREKSEKEKNKNQKETLMLKLLILNASILIFVL